MTNEVLHFHIKLTVRNPKSQKKNNCEIVE